MKIGQMSFPRLSEKSDYVQLDICGLNTQEAVKRAKKYNHAPLILHGDWTKNGFSENDIVNNSRQQEYLDIIKELKKDHMILGFTIHPPYRSKIDFESFVRIVEQLKRESGIPFFVENRSNARIWLSQPKEIIDFSNVHDMTIDIPQLFISCNYNESVFFETCEKINWNRVKEVHLANLVKKEKHTFVARKLHDGCIPIQKVALYFTPNTFITLEILGGLSTFEREREHFSKIRQSFC